MNDALKEPAKPVILSVDDEPEVLRAVVRDLRDKYAKDYRIVRSESGKEALEILKELKRKSLPVALFLVDQRMPEMLGTEFISKAMEIYPDARRMLLTAYADNDVAIRAINDLNLDYYLMKPWDPPEERLYPVLDDQLYHWQNTHRPEFNGIRIIDYQWSFHGHTVRDFIARNHLPYTWVDIQGDPNADPLLASIDKDKGLPCVVLADGTQLHNPTLDELAEKVGLNTKPEVAFYEVIVVGSGPAGLASAVAASTENIPTAMVEKSAPGGQAGTSSLIENYLGFPAGISGSELARRALDQAKRFGATLITNEVTGMRIDGQYKFVTLKNGEEISCHSLVIANGVTYNQLDIPGVKELEGLGVFYGAAMVEALACKNKEVFIIGAGNSAGQAAMLLCEYAQNVHIVCRRKDIRETMSSYLADRIERTENITVHYQREPVRVDGKESLERVTLKNLDDGEEETLPAGAMFTFIGATPHTGWVDDAVARDDRGFIVVGNDLKKAEYGKPWKLERDPYLTETSVPGVFAVGDVRLGPIKRVSAAVGDGSITQRFISEYLLGL